MKPKQIDQITYDSSVLTLFGWSRSGPPQAIRYENQTVYLRETIQIERADVAQHFGGTSISWGFNTKFDINLSDFDISKLDAVFPDGEIVKAAKVPRIYVKIVMDRFAAASSRASSSRVRVGPSTGHLKDLSDSVWGEQRIHSGSPRVESHFDAHLVPLTAFPDNDPQWGVYQSDGTLIEAAAHKRGPGRLLLGQSERMWPRQDFAYIDETAVYGGLTIPHFGHFLLSSLSRHWRNWKDSFPSAKIYMHTMENLDVWLARPYIRQIMGALGYDAADFVPISTPLRVRHLIVPAASFVEQIEGYAAFGETGRLIGERLWRGPPANQRPEPAYLSKENLKDGVWRVENESELVKIFRAAGIRIVYPEMLSLPDQIRIFAEHSTIIGLVGSAFHASLFSSCGRRLIGINPSEYLNSNFVMIDKIKGNSGRYLHLVGGMSRLDDRPEFVNFFRFTSPRVTAEEILRLI